MAASKRHGLLSAVEQVSSRCDRRSIVAVPMHTNHCALATRTGTMVLRPASSFCYGLEPHGIQELRAARMLGDHWHCTGMATVVVRCTERLWPLYSSTVVVRYTERLWPFYLSQVDHVNIQWPADKYWDFTAILAQLRELPSQSPVLASLTGFEPPLLSCASSAQNDVDVFEEDTDLGSAVPMTSCNIRASCDRVHVRRHGQPGADGSDDDNCSTSSAIARPPDRKHRKVADEWDTHGTAVSLLDSKRPLSKMDNDSHDKVDGEGSWIITLRSLQPS